MNKEERLLQEFLKRLEAKIDTYYDRNPKEIPTCDVDDVYSWIDETKKEMGIEDK